MGAIKLGGARRYVPLPAYRFAALFNSLSSLRIGFRRISGISIDQQLFEWDEGVALRTTRVLPGPHRAGDVTFERGVDVTNRVAKQIMFDWMQSGTTNDVVSSKRSGFAKVPPYAPQRTDILVSVFPRGPGGGVAIGRTGLEIRLHRCLPRKLEFSDLDATSSEFLITRLIVAPEAVTIRLPNAT